MGSLVVVHVHVHVLPDAVEAFRVASAANARASVKEAGVARFDVVQETGDPTRFVLVEVYRTPDDPPRHRETAHYARWAESVTGWLAEPRSKIVYANVFPDDEGWG